MTLERDVARHYATGGLLPRIDAALAKVGADPTRLMVDDLKPVDEFHSGGIEATEALLDQIELTSDMVIYDLGCGIGGTARHIVHRYGARVEGIDLTEDYVEAGRVLNERLGLGDAIVLHHGSVLDLPWEADSADLVTLFHVGMNVADKAALFAEVARALKPGGTFALFDVMRGDVAEELAYPLPWSTIAETSHVAPPATYVEAAKRAGLEQVAQRDRTDFTKAFFERIGHLVAEKGTPPLGIHLLMSGDPAQKLKNYVTNLHAGRVVPTEMIFRKPPT